MNTILLSIIIGIFISSINITPMIMKKLGKHECLSAFIQYIVVSIVIFNIQLPIIPWWLQGSSIALMLSLPIAILVAKIDKKSVPIIIINSIIWGALISLLKHFLLF